MTYFTFDTAYIVATMQNACNEAQKAVIRQRLANLRCQDRARWGREAFESFCYAWQNDCLADLSGGTLPRPSANPFPFKE